MKYCLCEHYEKGGRPLEFKCFLPRRVLQDRHFSVCERRRLSHCLCTGDGLGSPSGRVTRGRAMVAAKCSERLYSPSGGCVKETEEHCCGRERCLQCLVRPVWIVGTGGLREQPRLVS